MLRKSVCHRVKKFRTEVYLRIIDRLIHQSINKNLYSAPSRSLLRSAPEPGQAEKNSLQKLVYLALAPFGRCLGSEGSPFQVVGPTTEKELLRIVAKRTNETAKSPWTEDCIL